MKNLKIDIFFFTTEAVSFQNKIYIFPAIILFVIKYINSATNNPKAILASLIDPERNK